LDTDSFNERNGQFQLDETTSSLKLAFGVKKTRVVLKDGLTFKLNGAYITDVESRTLLGDDN